MAHLVVRLLFAAAVVWTLWGYAPPGVERPAPDGDGFAARFAAPTRVKGADVPFFFGLATAPAHVEDGLDDGWLAFARSGGVAAWSNAPRPELRNAFWTRPEVELDLAASTGVQVFRLGVDWGRLVPAPPPPGSALVLEAGAVARYRAILEAVHARRMQVMLTLFHHSMPVWAADAGGWTNASSVAAFSAFSAGVASALGDLVDWWVPFNEPTIFAGLTYCAGAWPPGFKQPGPLASAACMASPVGNYSVAMRHIAAAHRATCAALRGAGRGAAPIGVAHNVAYMQPAGVFDLLPAALSDALMLHPFVDALATSGDLDFVGLNYYGAEYVAGFGAVRVLPGEEYSDSGRAVYPDGLYHLLMAFAARHPLLPLVVTENGVADASDALRPSYLVEHLVAVAAARRDGAAVAGYVFWTVADNWEWADGYCPKFGLWAVDRADSALPRVPRAASVALFTAVVAAGGVTAAQADQAWGALSAAAAAGTVRPFCRAADGHTGLTGVGGLDVPVPRLLQPLDWRFGRWRPPPFADHLSRAVVALRSAVSSALGLDESALAERVAGLRSALEVRIEDRARARRAAAAAAAAPGGGGDGGGGGGGGGAGAAARWPAARRRLRMSQLRERRRAAAAVAAAAAAAAAEGGAAGAGVGQGEL